MENIPLWLCCVTFVVLFLSPNLSNGKEYNPLDEKLMQYADFTLDDLLERYKEGDQYNFWYPNTFKTGVQSREVVRISSVTRKSIPGVYKQWKSAQIGTRTIISGLTSHGIHFYNENLTLLGIINTNETLVALTTFGLWNDPLSRAELIVVVATAKPSLESYSFTDSGLTKLGTWPLQNKVKSLEICVVDLSTKIVVVAENSQAPVDIYNFEARQNSSQFWFFQRLNIGRHNCVAVHEVDSSTCSIAIASDTEIGLFSFEPKIGRFLEHNNLGNVSAPCHQLIPLRLSYSDYLAYVPAPESNRPVELFSESGIDYLNQNFSPIQALELTSLPVGNIRHEDILLLRTPNNSTKIFSYDGLKKMFKETFECTPDLCPELSNLTNGVGTLINGTTVFFVPTQEGQDFSTLLIIATQIDEYTSPLYERARQLYAEFTSLSEVYVRFQNIVASVRTALQDSLSQSEPNVITGNWSVQELSSFNTEIFDLSPKTGQPPSIGQNFEMIEFINSPLKTEDFLVDDSKVEARLTIFESFIVTAEERTAKTVPLDSNEIFHVTALQKINAHIETPLITSEHIRVAGVNDISTSLDHFFTGFVLTEDSNVEIKGRAEFTGVLAINNLAATQINGIPTNYFALLSSKNIFNTSIVFQSHFTVLGNIFTTDRIAGLNFPRDLILASNVTGVTLKNNLIALEKAELVDRVGSVLIDYDELEKNILLNDATQQNITSHITFKTIVLRRNGTVVTLNGKNFDKTVRSVVVKSQNGTIRGDKYFQYPNVTAEFLAIIKTLNAVPFPSGYISVKERHIIFHGCNNYSYILANSVDVNGTINKINTKDVVRRNSVGSEVNHSKWTLEGPVHFADDLHVRTTVAGVNVSDFHSHDTFDNPQSKYFPNHNTRFEAPVVLSSLHVFHTINGKSFDESFGNVLLCPENGQDITVHGPTTFQNDVQFENVIVKSNQVNGIDLDNFFLRNQEQNVTKNFVFTRPVHFSKIFALSNVDGVHLQDVLKDAIFLDRNQSLSPALAFESIISSAPVTINGPINNFTSFREDVALKTGRSGQTFESHIVFSDVQVQNLNTTENIAALSYLDGLNITRWNEERVSLSRDAVLHHPIEIFGDAIVHQNIIADSINNVSLDYLSQGVLRDDRTKQEFFNVVQNTGSLLVTGNVQFHQLLNGRSLVNIIRDSVPLHGHAVENITGHWRLENAVFHKLLVNGTTCGVDVLGLSRDSVRVNSTNVNFTGTTTFQGNLLVEDEIRTGSIDAVDFFNQVFTLSTPQIVTAKIVWKHDVNVHRLLQLEGKVNGVSLKHLNSIYSFQNGTHTLHADVNVDSFTVKNLIVDGLIQDKNLSEFLTLVVPKSPPNNNNMSVVPPVIHGNVIFTQPIISQRDILCETINNIRVSALGHSLIGKNSTFNFTNPVCFSNSVVARSLFLNNGNIVTVNDLVGQIDTQELQDNSIPLNSDTPIFSETLVFEDLVIDGDVEGVSFVNGIPISDYITLDSEQDLGSLKVSTLILTQNNITTKELFGGIDVGAAARDTVLIYNQNNTTITGTKNFTGSVLVNGEFHCLGVENVDQFVYLQERNQVIRSPVVFVDDLHVDGNVDWTGRWNGVSLKELEEYGVSSYDDDVISADWNYPGGIVFNNYTVSYGLIDGVNMTKLEQESRQKVVQAEDIIEKEQIVFTHTCQMYQKLYNYSTSSPIKLQSFDEQQLIVSDKHVGKMLTARAGHSLFLLTSSSDVCGMLVYRWSTAFEEFHELGLVHNNDIAIDNWVQAPHLDHGIIVFSSASTSNCHQSGEQEVVGLHFVLINEVGVLSAKVLIQNGTVASFKLVTDESKRVALLFVVYQERPQHITVYSWLSTNQTTFVKEVSFDMSSQVKILDVNKPLNGNVLILLQTVSTVSINVYSSRDRSLTQLSHTEFYGSSSIGTSMRMFEVDQSLYALVLMKNSERSSIKPDCSLQLFKADTKELQFVQKLKIYDMVSMEILRIGHQVFVVVLTKPVGLYVYKFMGLSGLQAINHYPLKFHGGENLSGFHVTPWRYNISLPFVLVSSRNVIKLYHSNILGNTVTDYGLQPDRNSLCNFQ